MDSIIFLKLSTITIVCNVPVVTLMEDINKNVVREGSMTLLCECWEQKK
jgi:hypothetical protein